MKNESPDSMEMLNQLLDERMDMLAERVADKVYQRMCETTPKSGQEWFDTDAVGEAFGVAPVTVRNHWVKMDKNGVCHGPLKAKRGRNKRLRIHRDDIQTYMNEYGRSLVKPEVLA